MTDPIKKLKKLRTELSFGCDGEAASIVGEGIDALNAAHEALQAFVTAYGSQDSGTAGLDKAVEKARSCLALTRPQSESSK